MEFHISPKAIKASVSVDGMNGITNAGHQQPFVAGNCFHQPEPPTVVIQHEELSIRPRRCVSSWMRVFVIGSA